ncbi:MAG: 4-(cytidine 5'-diphospho)-2-C-methyl-D-erythritol kinase [Magnetococcales bacterium]|nr:4-(cytidine 5'-diphospho)-2-C-methyl-D-erythritol kinase [Magnetococcales bacterium]
MTSGTFSAPAKVNLTLRVVGRRPDGYHLLHSIMTFFPLFDQLSITLIPDQLRLHCHPPVTDDPSHNLVIRAAERLRQRYGQTRMGAQIHLTKRIPVGAGLGGGSSDAATVLLALNQLWQLQRSVPELMDLAVTLGADIPFFLFGQTACVTGIGEQISARPDWPEQPMVLLYPAVALSTARVFQHFHERLTKERHATMLAPKLLRNELPWDEASNRYGNDLQPAAMDLAPEMVMAWQALHAAGAREVVMSGSGSTLCGLHDHPKSAHAAAASLRRDHPQWAIFSGTTFTRHPFMREWSAGGTPNRSEPQI